MAIGDDFSIALNGDIRHVSGTTTYTVLAFHRWLQDLADDQEASGNDLLDITVETPSDRSTDQIISLIDHSGTGGPTFNIDDDAAEYLFGGSISQKGGDELYSGLRVLGAVNDTDTQLMIVQDNGFYQYTTTPASPYWGTQSTGGYNGNAAQGVLMQIMVKSRTGGFDIDGKRIRVQARHWGDSYDFFNVTLGEGVSVAAIGTTPDAQNDTAQGTVTTYTHVVNSGGTANAPTGGYQTIDLNNGNGAQPYYAQWTFGADTSGDGLKGVWEYIKDLSGNGTAKTVDGLNGELFLGITHSLAYDNESGNFQEREEIVWGTEITYDGLVSGPFTPGNYVTIGSNGAAGRVMYDDGSSQLIVALDDTSITVLDDDAITEYDGDAVVSGTSAAVNVTVVGNALNGGSGWILGLDDQGTTGSIYMQLLTGIIPADDQEITGVTSTQTADVNGAPTARTVPRIFLGSYTGSLIGAYGIGILPADVTASDSLEDLTGTTQNPPNNVVFTVTGVVSSEDRVLVAPRAGSVIDTDQLTLSTALTSGTEGSVVVTTAIPSDTPDSGTIRVVNDSGFARYLEYTSYSGSTFTLNGTYAFNGSDELDGAASTNDVYITYIDKIAGAAQESFTVVYNADRDLFVRVRDGGGTPIRTFESTTATLTGTGGSVGVIRTTDA